MTDTSRSEEELQKQRNEKSGKEMQNRGRGQRLFSTFDPESHPETKRIPPPCAVLQHEP